MNADETAREAQHEMFNEGDDSQPSTSRAHSDYVENPIPMKLLNPKLEPLDDDSSRDGFTPLDSLAHIKTEAGMGRLSEMRSEDSRSEISNSDSKRYRVSFKVCSKAAARLKRILNAQPMALKRLGIAGVQVEPLGGMVSVTARAKERAAEEASRRPEPAHPGSIPTPSLPLPPQPQMRGAPDRNGDAVGMGPGFVPQTGPPHGHPGMHPGQMGVPPGHVNIQQPQMGDGSSSSGGTPISAVPPSALPPHMQQQRQSQPPPTNSPILVNLLNSQQPPPSVGNRPFSPYAPGYPGGPPGPGAGVPPSAQPQPGQPIDMAAYHQQMERQRMIMQQQQQQQQQMQQGVATPTTPGSAPGPSGYVYPQRPMFPGQQPGMYPPGHPPNAQQRVPYPGQPAMYGAMPQVKQEPITTGYSSMPQVKQEQVESAPPPAKKRKKPTKKQQQKEAEAQAAAQAQQAAAQPGPFFADGRMMHPQQMQGGFPGGAHQHAPFPQGAGGPPPPGMHPQYYQQQQQQQWQQQMQHQRMMQQQAQQQQQQHHQQQQQLGMTPEYPPGTLPAPPPGPSSAPWHPHQRPPPVPYPPGQNDGAASGVSAVTGTGDMGNHSESNSPVTPFGGHSNMVQQQPGHPSPMYGRESGGATPTLFPYPSTSHGGPGPSGPSGQTGLNSNPLTPGTTPQTPGGQQGQPPPTNDHHDFDDKLLGDGALDDLNLGDLDDIVPMGDLAMMARIGGEGAQARGEGRVKEELEDENGEAPAGGSTNSPIKRNGRHDLDMSINSVVDMVAKGGGELSSPTPPSTATPTGGASGVSAFPATTPAPNASSTAPPTPTLQAPPTPTVRRKNTASSVQQLTNQQRMQHMMGGSAGVQGPPFGMPVGGPPQGAMHPLHGHPHGHQMGHGPPHGHHLPHQQTPNNAPSGYNMEHHGRALPPSYHSSRGGRVSGIIENGRVNGHPELSNGNSSRDDNQDAQIQAILSKVKAQGMAQEQRAKEKMTNSGAKSRGGGTGTRKKRKANEITKERSPKEEEDHIYIGLDGVRGPSTMTAGQAAKARMGVGQGGGTIPGTYFHQISSQSLPMRPQPPQVQHSKPA